MPENTKRLRALITGASAGIGATFARALARRGYDLTLVARRRERLEELASELRSAHGIAVDCLAADLLDEAQLKTVEDYITSAEFLDLLVNNAGFGALGRFFQTDIDPQDRMHRLHVLVTMRLTHRALQGMTLRGHGAIINVSSVAAFFPTAASYSATKAWMNSFTEGLEMELRAAGSAVKVQALCPGFTITEFHDVAGMDRRLIPGWLWMKAEDVVEASLRGLERGRLIVVPGWQYKLLVAWSWLFPPPLRRPFISRYSRRPRR